MTPTPHQEDRTVTFEVFISEFVDNLQAKAADVRAFGAEPQAMTLEKIANDLSGRFRAWWLASLSIAEAARESGYAEETLRQMAREGRIAHTRTGAAGYFTVKRCDLPARPKAKAPDDGVAAIADRLLRRPRETAA